MTVGPDAEDLQVDRRRREPRLILGTRDPRVVGMHVRSEEPPRRDVELIEQLRMKERPVGLVMALGQANIFVEHVHRRLFERHAAGAIAVDERAVDLQRGAPGRETDPRVRLRTDEMFNLVSDESARGGRLGDDDDFHGTILISACSPGHDQSAQSALPR